LKKERKDYEEGMISNGFQRNSAIGESRRTGENDNRGRDLQKETGGKEQAERNEV